MEKLVRELEKENKRLHQLANLDELTGALNRRAAEQQIKASMSRGGALFVCDLDHFKNINDRYGHLIGDQCLIRAVRMLQKSIRSGDILGRIGGDEFVLFLYGVPDDTAVKNICRKIERRFDDERERSDIGFGISIAGVRYKPGDTYERLFNIADQQLIHIKEYKKKLISVPEASSSSWSMDTEYIRRDLTESDVQPGAFCRSYDSFKTIYHFLERTMRRNNRHAVLMVLSLFGPDKQVLAPQENARQMHALGEILRNHLRMGDVYTRYSSSQYLIMLIDANLEQSELVANRLKDNFAEAGYTAVLDTDAFSFPQRK